MHIPDGYLSPTFSLGTGIVTVPSWIIGARKLNKVLNQRTVPLLAIFSAFAFTLMLFNVPVPGGTTAHAVGGTLIAVVLGPWAAMIGISTALIIQALFFGDGGVLAIFTNCLNLAIILPFVGYATYKLLAGHAPLLSTRRVWAAAIGAYLGITAAALAVGIELGLQPILFHNAHGQPLYSPYPLSVAVPAMLLAHVFGASIVEALITALVFVYLQKSHPEYLTSLRTAIAGPTVPEGQAVKRPLWQIFALGVMGVVVGYVIIGLIAGHGTLTHLFGADWSQVSWSDIGSMLLVTAIIAIVLIPLAFFLLPRRLRFVGTLFVTIAIITPLGLIAPGFAFGEGAPSDVKAAFGYIPQGLQQLSGLFSAPFDSYNLQFPFFTDPTAPLWHAAIGYEISGILGMLLIGGGAYGLAFFFRQRDRGTSLSSASEEVTS
ncbi:MAG TPA: cobalt transporter CbiM [Ktedonobacteraceae bacterium]